MDEGRNTVENLIDALSRERDELRVKLELARLEMRDQWEPLEEKWNSLESKLRSVGDATEEAGKDVLAASKLLIGEIGEAYKDIWKQIKD